MSKPTVFVVDDDPATRALVVRILETIGLHAETYDSAQSFLEHVDPARRGCAVLDVRLPGMSGLELQERLRRSGHMMPVIFVTGFADVAMAVRAMRAGAVDFIEKPFRPQTLLDRVQQALALDEENRRSGAEQIEVKERFDRLTQREREVVALVVQGLSSKEIAEHFGLSPKTIHFHRSEAMAKVNAKSVAELARLVLCVEASEEST